MCWWAWEPRSPEALALASRQLPLFARSACSAQSSSPLRFAAWRRAPDTTRVEVASPASGIGMGVELSNRSGVPGVPLEMQAMLRATVLPHVRSFTAGLERSLVAWGRWRSFAPISWPTSPAPTISVLAPMLVRGFTKFSRYIRQTRRLEQMRPKRKNQSRMKMERGIGAKARRVSLHRRGSWRQRTGSVPGIRRVCRLGLAGPAQERRLAVARVGLAREDRACLCLHRSREELDRARQRQVPRLGVR